MAKWCGYIGFGVSSEIRPGVWKDTITRYKYFGEVIKDSVQYQSGNQANDNINVSNKISIIADPYATTNFHSMRYIEYMGSKWRISDVGVQYPRLIISLGGVYND